MLQDPSASARLAGGLRRASLRISFGLRTIETAVRSRLRRDFQFRMSADPILWRLRPAFGAKTAAVRARQRRDRLSVVGFRRGQVVALR